MAWELISCSGHLSNHYSLDAIKNLTLAIWFEWGSFLLRCISEKPASIQKWCTAL